MSDIYANIYGMIRTTVYLEKDLVVALRNRAEAEKRSQAEIIRQAIRRYLEDTSGFQRPPIVGAGSYRSGRSDVSKRAEELLRQRARKRR
jgi:metal-responsive CopG/Arc/MetJ family transcriptional regulator